MFFKMVIYFLISDELILLISICSIDEMDYKNVFIFVFLDEIPRDFVNSLVMIVYKSELFWIIFSLVNQLKI